MLGGWIISKLWDPDLIFTRSFSQNYKIRCNYINKVHFFYSTTYSTSYFPLTPGLCLYVPWAILPRKPTVTVPLNPPVNDVTCSNLIAEETCISLNNNTQSKLCALCIIVQNSMSRSGYVANEFEALLLSLEVFFGVFSQNSLCPVNFIPGL